MCGIVGLVRRDGEPAPDRRCLELALTALHHRGPDGAGTYFGPGVALGHTRLGIIDLAHGAQPMSNEDESVWVVYNGETWNFLEIRSELENLGHRFKTRCDTEVLVHGYEEWGDEVIPRLKAMFAVAIWDRTHERLLLARDRIGKKPLYFLRIKGGIAFGSDARSLLLACGSSPRLAPERVPEFLFQRYNGGPRTLFNGVERLEPGRMLTFERRGGATQTRRYWGPPEDPDTYPLEPRELREMLLDSTRQRLMSDVPLGVFLSGGIDSAGILGLMKEAGAQRVASFTVAFDDAVFDERITARITAERFGSEHHELVVSGDDFAHALPRLAWYRDEPIAEPAEVPLLLLAEFASRLVKVVLSGEGGDELFGGYPKYRAERVLAWPTPIARLILRSAAAIATRRRSHRQLQRALETIDIPDPMLRWASWFRSFSPAELQSILAPPLTVEAQPDCLTAPLRALLEPYARLDAGRRMLVGDLLTYLPDNMLARGDRVLMAASIEGRMPLLDHRVIERVARTPMAQRTGFLTPKKILREALRDLIPPEVMHAPKRGFSTPLAQFVLNRKGIFAEALVLSERALDRGLFEPSALRRLVEAAQANKRDSQLRLFTLASLELWQRANIDRLTPTPPSSVDDLLEHGEASQPRWARALTAYSPS